MVAVCYQKVPLLYVTMTVERWCLLLLPLEGMLLYCVGRILYAGGKICIMNKHYSSTQLIVTTG